MRQNYLPLKTFSLFYNEFIFIDVPQFLSDQLFIDNKVEVHYKKHYTHPNNPYVIIYCKVKKKDTHNFLSTLDKLYNKMLLCGHTDYENFCNDLINTLTKKK